MARDIQLAVAASPGRRSPTRGSPGGVDPTRTSVSTSAPASISTELDELAPAIQHAMTGPDSFDYQKWGRESIGVMEPIWLLKYLPNMLACHISILIDCQGPSNSDHRGRRVRQPRDLRGAAWIIARNRADVMISRGARLQDPPAEPGPPALYGQLVELGRGALRVPAGCSTRLRDGWVPGEGAGILIIEEREHALSCGEPGSTERSSDRAPGCDANPGGGLDPSGAGTEIAIRAAAPRGRALAG